MEGYDNEGVNIDRVNDSILIPHVCLSLFGTIQPEFVPHVFSDLDASMGFLPRFFLITANRAEPAYWVEQGISDGSTQIITDLISDLLQYEFNENDDPVLISMSPEARSIYIEWYNHQATEPWREFHAKSFDSVLAKLKGQCFRLSLILHCMESVAEGCSETSPISLETMRAAIRLTDCLKSHQKYNWENIVRADELSSIDPLAERVLEAIIGLESEIKNSMLLTSVITEKVNSASSDTSFHVSSKQVGKAAKHLDLKHKKSTGGARNFFITDDDLQRLKILGRKYDILTEIDGRGESGVSGVKIEGIKEIETDDSGNSGESGIYFRDINEKENLLEKESIPEKNATNAINATVTNKPQNSDNSFFIEKHAINATNATLIQDPDSLKSLPQENIKRLFIDTETTGLDPLTDKIVLIQMLTEDQVFIIDVDKVGPDFSIIKDLMENEDILKVFHNAIFDVKFLKKHIGCEVKNIFDTFIAERLLTTGIVSLRELGLKYLSKKYLEFDLDKSLSTSFKPGEELSPKQIRYASDDIKVLEPIFNIQKKKIVNVDLKDTALLEFSIVPAIADIELKGALIDVEKLDTLKEDLEERLVDIEEQLKTLTKDVNFEAQREIFKGANVNFRSAQQMKEIFKHLGMEVESTGIEVLKKIDHPFAKILIQHRKTSKLLSSFVLKLPKHINADTGRIHPEFPQLGTDTGRFVCQKPNLQQIPKEQEWRDLFIAPPGYKMITADFSQIELRILAEFSHDPVFLEAYQKGEDLHQRTADQIGVSRGIAKTINFGLCYGMGSSGLASRLNISEKKAREFIMAYFKAYPQVKKTLDELGMKAVKFGYSETPLGRKRYFKPADSIFAQKSLERKGRNTRIQSTCGDILKRAILYLSEDLRSLDANIVNLVHDEIVLEVNENDVEVTEIIIKDDMIKAGKDFLKSVPVEVDIIVDNVWRK